MEFNTESDIAKQAGQATANIINIGHLLDYLRRVKEGRKRRGIRYPVDSILALFILAKLCGENKVYGIADWVQLRSEYLIDALGLKLKRRLLPHHSTYRRILTNEISADDLEIFFSEYLAQLPRRDQEMVIVIDGKIVRGTITVADPFGLHLLAAYLPGEGIVLMQMEVDQDKENRSWGRLCLDCQRQPSQYSPSD